MVNSRLAWGSCLAAALFFFYNIFQMTILNTLASYFVVRFHVDPVQLGNLASSFFYANALALIPAGLLLDRFSKRSCLLLIMVLGLVSRILLTVAQSWFTLIMAQALAGVVSAFALVGCLRLVADLFPPEKQAQMMGLMITIGLFGGVISQAPFTALLLHTSAATALWSNVILGGVIFIIMALLIRDNVQLKQQITLLVLIKQLKKVVFDKQNNLSGIYLGLLNLTINLLAVLWGSLYLQHAGRFSPTNAALISSMTFFGMMLGSPLMGWISDRIQLRRLPMIFGPLFSIGIIALIILFPSGPIFLEIILFFALGFFSAAQIIIYTSTVEYNGLVLASTATSFLSIWLNVLTAITQPLFGWLVMINMARGDVTSYRIAMLLLPVAYIISLIAVLLLKETKK